MVIPYDAGGVNDSVINVTIPIACMDTGARVTEADCRVASNLSKQCVWSPGGAAALAPLSSRVAHALSPPLFPRPFLRLLRAANGAPLHGFQIYLSPVAGMNYSPGKYVDYVEGDGTRFHYT